MNFCRNISVSGGIPANYQPEQQLLSPSCTLDDLFSGHSTEEGDINMEWLSIFVEDCLSSSGNCLPPTLMPSNPQSTTSNAQGTTTTAATASENKTHLENNLSLHKLVVPCKARSKRKRSIFKFKGTSPLCMTTDPPLLHQAYWLADSELILPNKSTSPNSSRSEDSGQAVHKQMKHEEETGTTGQGQEGKGMYKQVKQEEETGSNGQGQGRKCTHCLSQRTPQWRAGPEGPKTLCNACGVRYKSGRLLPEYRPAKSPTFVSYKHSNSHKKVLEMRMSSSSSS